MDWLSAPDDIAKVFAGTLIGWYEHHKRDLPWRHTRDPYRIWLSEIILQQTRIAQGLPYYKRIEEAFPTIWDLAAADEQELLRLWQGLGYYSRARNLHQTAKTIVHQHEGHFPDNYHSLLQLPGIGTYTAAAIASFAFQEKIAVVDGNVFRVLARIFGIEDDITTNQAKKTFFDLANQLIRGTNDPATFNQAIMEFGALQCTPLTPDCLFCPFQQHCQAFLTSHQHRLPVKSKKKTVRERFFQYLVIQQLNSNGEWQVAMRERRQKDVWQHLYDFFLIETEKKVNQLSDLRNDASSNGIVEAITLTGPIEERTHILSHQRIIAQFWPVVLPTEWNSPLPEGIKFYKLTETERLPKATLIADYLKDHIF